MAVLRIFWTGGSGLLKLCLGEEILCWCGCRFKSPSGWNFFRGLFKKENKLWLSQFQLKKSSFRAKALPRLLHWGAALFACARVCVCSALFSSEEHIWIFLQVLWRFDVLLAAQSTVAFVLSMTKTAFLYLFLWQTRSPWLVLIFFTLMGMCRLFFLIQCSSSDRIAGGWTGTVIRSTATRNTSTMWWISWRCRSSTCLQGHCVMTPRMLVHFHNSSFFW